MEAERPKDIITPEEVHMVVSGKDIMGRWKKLHPITMQVESCKIVNRCRIVSVYFLEESSLASCGTPFC